GGLGGGGRRVRDHENPALWGSETRPHHNHSRPRCQGRFGGAGEVWQGAGMTSAGLLLSIDQGTTSTRAILFDASGTVCKIARRELRQIYPRPGWVEHDPEEIWQAVAATSREAIEAATAPVAAIGITNQRE